MLTKNCVFCNGTGKISRFMHIDNGKCYRCMGTGKAKVSLNDNQVQCAGCSNGIKIGELAKNITNYDNEENEIDLYLHDTESCSGKYIKKNKIDCFYSTLVTV